MKVTTKEPLYCPLSPVDHACIVSSIDSLIHPRESALDFQYMTFVIHGLIRLRHLPFLPRPPPGLRNQTQEIGTESEY